LISSEPLTAIIRFEGLCGKHFSSNNFLSNVLVFRLARSKADRTLGREPSCFLTKTYKMIPWMIDSFYLHHQQVVDFVASATQN
jgi:hypothetical protein